MNEKINLIYKGNKFEIDLKSCNLFRRFLGLMFTKKAKAKALLFNFKKPTKTAIHSFFVFFPFIALWLNNENKIIDLKIIRPFRFFVSPKKAFYKLIEIPINNKYKKIIKLLVDD